MCDNIVWCCRNIIIFKRTNIVIWWYFC